MYNATEILISIIVTVVAYLLVPTIVILIGKNLKKKTITTITIINCIVVWFVFRIVQTEINGVSGTGAAVFIWGAVGNWLMRKNCLAPEQDTPKSVPEQTTTQPTERIHISPSQIHHTRPHDETTSSKPPSSYSLSSKDETPKRHGSFYIPAPDLAYVPPENNTTATTYAPSSKVSSPPPAPPASKKHNKYCSRCGNVINSETKKCTGCGKQYFKGIKWKTVIIVILLIMLAASIAGNVYQYSKNAELNNLYDFSNDKITRLENTIISLEGKVSHLNDELTSLESNYNYYYTFYADNWEKLSFFDKAVVFVEDDGTYLYHNYDCYKFVGNYYWAYNIEYAEYRGYSPCPLCCD